MNTYIIYSFVGTCRSMISSWVDKYIIVMQFYEFIVINIMQLFCVLEQVFPSFVLGL